jgi:hypothetical protein
MTISHLFLVEGLVRLPTSSFFVLPVIEVSQTVAFVKYTTERWEPIAVMGRKLSQLKRHPPSVPVPRKKAIVVKREPPMPMVVVTYINTIFKPY